MSNQLLNDFRVLEDGETAPLETTLPPRKPQLLDTFNYIANPDQFCRQNVAKYGPIFQTSVFGGTTVFIGSAKVNQMVFNGDSRYTEIALPPTTMDMFGEYSLFQRPDLHRSRKSALSPAFTGQMLEGYLPLINQIILQGIQSWKTPSSLAVFPAVENICFDVLVPLLLGLNLNNKDSFNQLSISYKTELKALYKTFFDGFYGLVKWKFPLTVYGRGYQAREKLIDFMESILQQRRNQKEVINPRADFLSMMLADQQENPTGIFEDNLIKNQCLLQLWASHYEISGLVSSLIYQIGRHPHVKKRLLEEQTGIMKELRSDTMITSQQLKQMVFLEATIKETLRTLSPSSTANRKLIKSVVLDGVLYQKGWVLIAEPRIAHTLPEHFKDPESFEPERFLPPRQEGKMYEFIAFGGGVHACLGAQMAMLITKVFAYYLLLLLDWEVTQTASFVQFPLKKLKSNYQIPINSRGT